MGLLHLMVLQTIQVDQLNELEAQGTGRCISLENITTYNRSGTNHLQQQNIIRWWRNLKRNY